MKTGTQTSVFGTAAAGARRHEPAIFGAAAELEREFHFWHGVSGRRYVHTIHNLFDCPKVPQANYILVHRDDVGKFRVLRIDRTTNQSGSLNLAEIRHRAALLGANEVHVHLLGDTEGTRQAVELDIRAAQLDLKHGAVVRH